MCQVAAKETFFPFFPFPCTFLARLASENELRDWGVKVPRPRGNVSPTRREGWSGQEAEVGAAGAGAAGQVKHCINSRDQNVRP